MNFLLPQHPNLDLAARCATTNASTNIPRSLAPNSPAHNFRTARLVGANMMGQTTLLQPNLPTAPGPALAAVPWYMALCNAQLEIPNARPPPRITTHTFSHQLAWCLWEHLLTHPLSAIPSFGRTVLPPDRDLRPRYWVSPLDTRLRRRPW